MSSISIQKPLSKEGLFSPVSYSEPYVRCLDPEFKDYLDPLASRRMSRIIKRSIITSSDVVKHSGISDPDAIITGTGYGCIEDTEKFLDAMVFRGEDYLQPTFFIQSTHNTVSSQVAIRLGCHGFNNTHSHKGVSFENALLESYILFQTGRIRSALIGGHDELPPLFYTILGKLPYLNDGVIASEGSTSFMLSTKAQSPEDALLDDVMVYYKPGGLREMISGFLEKNHHTINDIDLIMTGMNGNQENDRIYLGLKEFFPSAHLALYKHLCGEYPTSAGYGLFASASILQEGRVPAHLTVDGNEVNNIKRILIYNHCRNTEHSLILISNA